MINLTKKKNIITEESLRKIKLSSVCFLIVFFSFTLFNQSYANYEYSGDFSKNYLEKDILSNKFNYDKVYSFTDRLNENAIPYNEGKSASIYDTSKQADNALIQALLRHKIPLIDISLESSYIKNHNKTIFLYQKIRIYLPKEIKPESFNKALKENLNLWAEAATIEYSEKQKKSSIYIDKQLTHEIYYNKPQSSAKLSIVIDDLGGSIDTTFDLFSLDFPVSFSILPDTNYASLTAELAHYANREVYLHQPMLALKGRFVVSDTLLPTDTKESIKKKLTLNYSRVPYASAINNHTGSSFTQNTEAVQRYLEVQQELNPHIHILDSKTIAASTLLPQALQYGFIAKEREVFIDNVQNQQAIEKQLNKALRLAIQTNSHVIVIGHPYKETIQALKNWKTYKNENVEIVSSFGLSYLSTQGLTISPYVQSLPAPFVSAPSYQP